jgi:hypothetical protein
LTKRILLVIYATTITILLSGCAAKSFSVVVDGATGMNNQDAIELARDAINEACSNHPLDREGLNEGVYHVKVDRTEDADSGRITTSICITGAGLSRGKACTVASYRNIAHAALGPLASVYLEGKLADEVSRVYRYGPK